MKQIVSAHKPKRTPRKKPAPEIEQRIVKAYSPKRLDRLKRLGRHPRDFA